MKNLAFIVLKGDDPTSDSGGKNVCLCEEISKNNDMLISMTELFLTVTVFSYYTHKSGSLKQ